MSRATPKPSACPVFPWNWKNSNQNINGLLERLRLAQAEQLSQEAVQTAPMATGAG